MYLPTRLPVISYLVFRRQSRASRFFLSTFLNDRPKTVIKIYNILLLSRDLYIYIYCVIMLRYIQYYHV